MSNEKESFTDWVIRVSYAFTIWRLGGLVPAKATSQRLSILEKKGKKIMRRYGEGPMAALAHLDENRYEFQWFLHEGLVDKTYEYWAAVMVQDELRETKAAMH